MEKTVVFLSLLLHPHTHTHTHKQITTNFKGPIQVLANSLKEHDYNNLAFEVYANKSLKIMYQKQIIIPIKSSTY
jgi:hypothetical protein